MHTLRSKISIRGQAILVMAIVLSWYGSIIGSIKESRRKEAFFGALMILLPLLITVFAVILIKAYQQSDKTNRGWLMAAIIAASTCWSLIAGWFALLLAMILGGH